MKIIDPHLHLFNLKQGDYHWLNTENAPFWPDKAQLNKSFFEHDLTLTAPLSLAGFVHIEAGFDNVQPWREIDWLESHCQRPFSSIAAIDLSQNTADFTANLATLTAFNSVVGVRHILDEQALALLSQQQVQQNIKRLNQQGLIFEVQMPLIANDAVDVLCKIIADNQNMSFIINHAGLPPLTLNSVAWQCWKINLTKLAIYPNVAMKCSGWEMTNRQYQPVWLIEVLSVCVNTFGPQRVMLASNFPLCLFSYNYQSYWQNMVENVTLMAKGHDDNLAEQLFTDNAKRWYQINT